MKALIDADIFQHEYGNATDAEYRILPWPLVQARVQGRIDKIMKATGADSYQLYLTTDDKSNFRYDIATIRPYKGHRKTEKPFWYTHIRNFLVDYRGAIEVSGMEADDALAIEQYLCNNIAEKTAVNMALSDKIVSPKYMTVICSRDKDLSMVPGWHYGWSAGGQKEKEMWWQDELEGLKLFYCQLLTGDSVDNIPGLFGVGKSSKLLGRVHDCNCEFDMYTEVYKEYEKRFGSYAESFLLENGRLLWMKRTEEDLWEPPTK